MRDTGLMIKILQRAKMLERAELLRDGGHEQNFVPPIKQGDPTNEKVMNHHFNMLIKMSLIDKNTARLTKKGHKFLKKYNKLWWGANSFSPISWLLRVASWFKAWKLI